MENVRRRTIRQNPGGNDIENVIADAYIKQIEGVSWDDAYRVVKGNSQALRSVQYVNSGYQYDSSESGRKVLNGGTYSYRLYPSSATMGFAYNDYAAAVMAKGLGETARHAFQRRGGARNKV